MTARRTVLILGLMLTGAAAAAADPPPALSQPPSALLQPPPACLAEREGTLSCQAGRVCQCLFKSAVPARGLPDRWIWDCDIKRPACETTPASPGLEGVAPPEAIVIERRDDKSRKAGGGPDRP